MKRGNLVTVATQGDFGKPRPALIIQSDFFGEHSSISLLPLTSTLIDAPLLRVTLNPDDENNLQQVSQVMIDKVVTVAREKIGTVFGQINASVMIEVERCLAVFLGIAR